MIQRKCTEFIQKIPKAELHLHIEGTMEPTMLEALAVRNDVILPASIFNSSGKGYRFHDLNSFLDTYFATTQVLCIENDFYDITLAYLKKVHEQGVVHVEIFFDLQSYIGRINDPACIINGMHRALLYANTHFQMSGGLIMCFLRNLSEQDADKALDLIIPFKDKILGVGLAAYEKNNPAAKFKNVFARAREYGFHCVAHAGEVGSAQDIWGAMDVLKAERIDHAIACVTDPALMSELVARQLPLTVCPLSNVRLHGSSSIEHHPIRQMFDAGLMVTINSDDPAFFGGYIAENYLALVEHLRFSCAEIVILAQNSIKASFMDSSRKKACLDMVDTYAQGHTCR